MLRPLDEAALRRDADSGARGGFEACAIVFLHGYRYPAHEARAAEIARDAGFTQISTSHETVPLMKFVSRGDTTVADAYLSPVLARYANRIAHALGEVPRLFFMTSNGGLAAPEFFRGKDAIVSGPAGGVVGMAETAREAGFERVIGFDMGGTSTDVARFDGAYRARLRNRSRGRAAARADDGDPHGGGGRRLDPAFRRRALPRRTGHRPAPIPGPPVIAAAARSTVTDANVMVGKLAGILPAHLRTRRR